MSAPQKGYAGYHNSAELLYTYPVKQARSGVKADYDFSNFFHPYIGELIKTLNRGTLTDLLSLDPSQTQHDAKFFGDTYSTDPDNTGRVKVTSHEKEIELDFVQPYANYNWELFYHIPVAIAVHLSANQRFAEARKWFHFVFDPTSADAVDPPKRFWKFRWFRDHTDPGQIDKQLALLSDPKTAGSAEAQSVLKGYRQILANPFNPHIVARSRPLAYQYYVVMKYLDNLIAWGDSLLVQYTGETVTLAAQLYVLVANILGERPQKVPAMGTSGAQTYHTLRNQPGFNGEVGNALVELEGQFPFNLNVSGSQSGDGDQAISLFGIGKTLYFCVPFNDRMLAYWDIVADRLFKIRHCLNIAGVEVPLPLFDPPLDPGMLVKAAAAGIDVGSIVNGLNQPIGPVRSLVLIQKALELAGEVRSLGGSLLSALEKRDAEHLAVVRQGHEIVLHQMMQDSRFLQWKQAQEATETLLRTRASALERYRYYQRLLGIAPDANAAPDTFTPDRRELTEDGFDDAYAAFVTQYDKPLAPLAYPPLSLAAAASPSTQSGASGSGVLYLNTNESDDLNVHTPLARELRLIASTIEAIGGIMALIPDINVDAEFWGLGAHSTVFGGTFLAAAARGSAAVVNIGAMLEEGAAAAAAKVAGYQRRADEWMLQHNLAARELTQIGRQIISSLIAEQVAHHEYQSVQKQLAQSQEILDTMQGKFTNEELYDWMQGELFRLHQGCYRFALDVARRAERTMKQELMRPELDGTDFVQFNYFEPGRNGLLAGEKLFQDIKRMELAYLDNNRREYELTQHVSLRQLDPLALLAFKVTGTCQFSIPEWLYDRYCPGKFLRRITGLAVSIPSIVGPYTGINCTLSLLQSSVRKSAVPTKYPRSATDTDARFIDYPGQGQAMVTSTGTNDSGMHDPNSKPEYFRHFELAGAISSWQLSLPPLLRSLDYATMVDVILHIRHTAREGGAELAKEATKNVSATVESYVDSGLALLFSLRQDFAAEWTAFVSGKSDLTVRLRKQDFPYLVQDRTCGIETLELYDWSVGGSVPPLKRSVDIANIKGDLNSDGQVDITLAPVGDALGKAAHAFLIARFSAT